MTYARGELRKAIEASFEAWRRLARTSPETSWCPTAPPVAGLLLHAFGGQVGYALAEARRVVRYLEAVANDEEARAGAAE